MNSELRSRAHSTLNQIVDLAMVTGVDPHRPLWRVFWADVVELAVAFTLETTAGDLDDIIDHIWARITQGQKPHQEHRALHHFLLVTAGLDKSEHLETILMLSGSATKLPRVQDRATTLAIFSALDHLRDAFERHDPAGARTAITTYVDLLSPDELPARVAMPNPE